MWTDGIDADIPIVALAQGVHGDGMASYLSMMQPRLAELRRILKPSGSLYLHCDPKASHYLKIMLDMIFGAAAFKNEIAWKRTFAHSSANRWGPIHDVILFYAGKGYTWNRVTTPYSPEYIASHYRHYDDKGLYRKDSVLSPEQGSRDNLTYEWNGHVRTWRWTRERMQAAHNMGILEYSKTGLPRQKRYLYRYVDLMGPGAVQNGSSGEPWRGVDPSEAGKGRNWSIPMGILRKAYPERDDLDTLTSQAKLDLLDAAGLIHWPKNGAIPKVIQHFDECKGVVVQDMIMDIAPINSQSVESADYPTQKPLALLERIIKASSNEGDVVLDPFCGSGSTLEAASRLGRDWIGIDASDEAIATCEKRLLLQPRML